MQEFMGSFIWMLAALAAVLALAWFALRFVQRRPNLLANAKTQNEDTLKFVRALPVGTRERVVIVEHRGQRWMLGVTAGGISTIATWTGEGVESAATAERTMIEPASGETER